jgi:ribonucleotide reductase beta subunit family protein with ferritin-like domain
MSKIQPNSVVLEPVQKHSKLFFGECNGILRIDDATHQTAKNLVNLSQDSIWFYNEHTFTEDILGWNTKVCPISKRMFELIVGYQTCMDSGVSKAIPELIGNCSSNSFVKFLYNWIGVQENTHAFSYSYMLDAMFGSIKMQEILDNVYTDEYTKKRMDNEIDGFDKLDAAKLQYEAGSTPGNMRVMKKALLEALVHQMIIEELKFPPSFFAVYAIHHSNGFALPNVYKMYNQINFDEKAVHVTWNAYVLKTIFKDPEGQGFDKDLVAEVQAWSEGLVDQTIKDEIEWVKYICRDGSIKHYNVPIMEEFINYQAYQVKKYLGLKVPKQGKPDSVRWYDIARDENIKNTSQQENSSTAYIKGLEDDLGSWTPA